MTAELNLSFANKKHVVVALYDGRASRRSGMLKFKNPITPDDRKDIRWYIENYPIDYAAEPDDDRAGDVVSRIQDCGRRLFAAVFDEHQEAHDLFRDFAKEKEAGRLLSISAELPSILSLPWELLFQTEKGAGYVFQHEPAISICRRYEGTAGSVDPFVPTPKTTLRLLFVISRPEGAGFIDPRSEASGVLDAIDTHAPGRIEVEFLRPPTFKALRQRLRQAPAVDIIHFDGHGSYRVPDNAEQAKGLASGKTTDAPDTDLVKKGTGRVGHLLFEDADGNKAPITADLLGQLLFNRQIPLVVLSACQSASLGEDDDPMSCTAARLTAAGVPAVVAMTHSVLVSTAQTLFGEFYAQLAQGEGIGASLDTARWALFEDTQRHKVRRGNEFVTLELHDWFLPALYQSGPDVPLLLAPSQAELSDTPESATATRSNLPKVPEAGFFGRQHELWRIGRWFDGPTRRITITGFGGQGKTALALEAGRWFTRTGQFRAAVLVDYSRIQSLDATSVAVANIGEVLGESLLGADAATEALKKTPTLVILDNLEALADKPLNTLLSAAVAWSTAGASRVLCTTRRPEFGHADYGIEGTNIHRRIALDGLGDRQSPDEALAWFAELWKLPPKPTVSTPARAALVELFDEVRFHPLSIRVLAQQLKTRRPAELGERLGELLAEVVDEATLDEDTPAGLVASLRLSLDRLDEQSRAVVKRLGVFQGGACEDDLLAITGLGEMDARGPLEQLLAAVEAGDVTAVLRAMGAPNDEEPPAQMIEQITKDLPNIAAQVREQLAKSPEVSTGANLWPALRRQLESAALIEAETIPGVDVPFLRFHPTLAPMLWNELDAEEQAQLAAAHRQRYYALANYLYNKDTPNPHQARAIARRELPNLLHAAHAALDAGVPEAVDFADSVNRFLNIFGLKQESEALIAKSQAAAGEVGSKAWYLAQSHRGEQLLSEGQVAKAAAIFEAVLKQLGEEPSYEQAQTLGCLGRCFRAGGRPDQAEQHYREALSVLDQLEQTDSVKRERGVRLTDLADVLRDQGKYAEAHTAYRAGLEIGKELNDIRGQGVTLGQLGTLAMLEGNLTEAIDRHRDALALFQQLGEPAMEAVAWHQLGRVFQEARQWDEAERHYRQSARIEEDQGNLAGAARTWNQLANVSRAAGKPEAAESWYRKAIDGFQAVGDEVSPSTCLNNLANLLQDLPGRLPEARKLAEESLTIAKTLDPGAAEIWKTHDILAEIADREAKVTGDTPRQTELRAEAREHRRCARQAKWDFAGTRHELGRHMPLILGVLVGLDDPKQRAEIEQLLPEMEKRGWTNLVAALRRILADERDEEAICQDLVPTQAVIVMAILRAIADPSTLADLMPGDAGNQEQG